MTTPEKKFVGVLGRRMAYRELGDPASLPIVFLHGNPTSSFLWRNIVPHVQPHGRCLLPDLIGMGDSDKIPGEGDDRYSFTTHARFLDGFLKAVGATESVTLVVHDWGSALGFDWAARNESSVRGIAYMEAICAPLSIDDWPSEGRSLFEAMRQPEVGEDLVLTKNAFVERLLPASVLRDLTEEEMAEYRRPFATKGEDRRPTLAWPRQLPFDGEPSDVASIVASYSTWMVKTGVPKLYVHAEPGFMSRVFADTCRTWPNQTEITANGIHFVQEDSPDIIGRGIADWMSRLPATR